MAGRAVSAAVVQAFMKRTEPGKPLPLFYFVDSSSPSTWRATAFLVKCRAGGFMVVPGDDRVIDQLQDLSDPELHEHPLLYVKAKVEVETPRRSLPGMLHYAS